MVIVLVLKSMVKVFKKGHLRAVASEMIARSD